MATFAVYQNLLQIAIIGQMCSRGVKFVAIFTTLYLKRYLRYDNDTFRAYRWDKCLYIPQISDLYVLFYVRYRISKLGSRSTKPQFWAFFYHFEVLCFHTQTQIHINFSFYFGRAYRKVQEKGWTEKIASCGRGEIGSKNAPF